MKWIIVDYHEKSSRNCILFFFKKIRTCLESGIGLENDEMYQAYLPKSWKNNCGGERQIIVVWQRSSKFEHGFERVVTVPFWFVFSFVWWICDHWLKWPCTTWEQSLRNNWVLMPPEFWCSLSFDERYGDVGFWSNAERTSWRGFLSHWITIIF